MSTKSKKILISAYACEPNLGSEPGVGWSWVLELAGQYEEVHVVTRTEDRYIDADGRKKARPSRQNIEKEIANIADTDHIHFHYYDLPAWITRFERTIIGDILNVYLWELLVFFFLKKRFRKNEFDVAQKVTIVSHRYPSCLWYFAHHYIHGPIAGGEGFPLKLLSFLHPKNQVKEILRIIFRESPRFNPLVLYTWHKADKIIPVTYDTAAVIPKRFRHKCEVKQAISLKNDNFERGQVLPGVDLSPEGPLRLLYVGKLMEFKGIKFILRALQLIHQEIPLELTLIGEGPDREHFSAVAQRHQLPVHFVGKVARTELPDHYASHDLFLFPSLRDSGGFVVLEAQANDLPCLVLDLGGPYVNHIPGTDIVVHTKGKKPEDLIRDIAAELKNFYYQNKKPSLESKPLANGTQ